MARILLRRTGALVACWLAACSGGSPSGQPSREDAGARDAGAEDASEEAETSDASHDRDAAVAEAGPRLEAGRPHGLPPEVLAHAKDWPMANRDYASTRATFDTTITSANVATLAEAWTVALTASAYYGAATAVPLVLGGTVYYQDMDSNVFAIEARTGALLWQREYSQDSVGPNGLAVGWGKVFGASSDRSFVALDLATGAELWQAPIPIPKNGGIDIAPIAYDGLVYTSTVPLDLAGGYNGGGSGVLYALDERTGAIVWSFDTDESGNLWGDPVANSGGGAWYPPTVDEARGLTFWGTGNPGPLGAGADRSRPGPNLYTCSVVALSSGAGALRWYHQERPHDLFDLDFQNSPIIADVTIDGGIRHVVLGSGKTGTIVALDADTGRLLWRASVGKHSNDDATNVPDAGLWVYPGLVGGVETPPAYADGVLYVPYEDYGFLYSPAGLVRGSAPAGGLVALDAATGGVLWKVEYGGGDGAVGQLVLGGATVANDLVFTATQDGTVYAYDRGSGHEVWRYVAPDGINAPPSIAGDSLYVAAGTGIGTPSLVALRLR